VAPAIVLFFTFLAATALLVVVSAYVTAITRVLREFGAREGCDLQRIVGALHAIEAETAILLEVARTVEAHGVVLERVLTRHLPQQQVARR